MESNRLARGKERELGCWVAVKVGSENEEVEERGARGIERGRVLVGVKEERKKEVAAIVEGNGCGEEREGGDDKVLKRRRVQWIWSVERMYGYLSAQLEGACKWIFLLDIFRFD